MSKQVRLLISLIIIFSCAISPVCAENKPSKSENQQESKTTLKGNVVTVNLRSIVEYTLTQNLDMKIANARIEQAKYNYRGSYAYFLPSLQGQLPVERFQGGEIFYGPIPISLTRTTYRPILAADYQLFTGGKPIFDMLTTKNQYNRIKIAYQTTLQKTLLDACRTYFEWLAGAADVDVADQSLQEAEKQLQYNNSRLKTGFGTKLDVLQTKTMVQDRKSLVLKAENKKDSSRINLAALLNISPAMQMEPEKPYIEPLSLWDKELTLPQLYDIASKTRPDIKELAYLISVAKAQYKSSITGLFPTISGSGYTRGIGPDIHKLDSTMQGLVSFNLNFLRNLGFGSYHDVKASKARIKEAILNREKVLNDIYKTIAQSYYDCKYYQEQLQITKDKKEDAKEAYKIAAIRLKGGVGLNLEVIHAQSELTKANLEYQTAVKNYNVSQLSLLYECGQLTPDKILSAFK